MNTILHLGLGSFHRAHQAVYVHQLRHLGDLSWGITAGNLRPDMPDTIAALQAQGGAYTLETVTPQGERSYTVIESIQRVIPYQDDLAPLIATGADPATRTFTVKVALPAQAELALGSTVTVLPSVLQRSGAPVIKLPTSALRHEGQVTAVWLLDAASMTVKSQPVQIASADGNEVVVTGGLQPGMQVVVTGVHVLAAGQKVSLYKADKPS